MPRPHRLRRVSFKPECLYFKPRGVPLKSLQEILVGLDELEALRLADYEGMYQEEAAARMDISRQTFARVVQSARHKIAEALIEGKALKLEGGRITTAAMRQFKCFDCGHSWEMPFGGGRPTACPNCESGNIYRADGHMGRGRHGRGGRRFGRCRQPDQK